MSGPPCRLSALKDTKMASHMTVGLEKLPRFGSRSRCPPQRVGGGNMAPKTAFFRWATAQNQRNMICRKATCSRRYHCGKRMLGHHFMHHFYTIFMEHCRLATYLTRPFKIYFYNKKPKNTKPLFYFIVRALERQSLKYLCLKLSV